MTREQVYRECVEFVRSDDSGKYDLRRMVLSEDAIDAIIDCAKEEATEEVMEWRKGYDRNNEI